MIPAPHWTAQELDNWRLQSIQFFRQSRLEEPLEKYGHEFDRYRSAVEDLIERTVDLSQLRQQAAEILAEPSNREIVRYFAGPPISEDDLKTLVDAPSLASKQLDANPSLARAVIDLIIDGLDQRRFPWVRDGREPTETERHAAVIASATLLAYRKVATDRRNSGKEMQEVAVVAKLVERGWREVPRRAFATVNDAPEPGSFCRETRVGNNKADILVRLLDKRIAPIECKVSNSSLNSIKRLNDAKKKATDWIVDFGRTFVVPIAVLSGVFDLRHLEETQSRGLALFWGHDLDRLADWIESTKPEPPSVPANSARRKRNR